MRIATAVPLTQAALQLGKSYWSARDLVLRREISGFQDPRGRWFVHTESLAAQLGTAPQSAAPK